eukprot:15339940-Ditylum_brightwellii.AAC.1
MRTKRMRAFLRMIEIRKKEDKHSKEEIDEKEDGEEELDFEEYDGYELEFDIIDHKRGLYEPDWKKSSSYENKVDNEASAKSGLIISTHKTLVDSMSGVLEENLKGILESMIRESVVKTQLEREIANRQENMKTGEEYRLR